MKNGKVHRVPLTADAVALLQSVPRLQGSNLVFHAARGGTLSDASLSAVMKRMHAAKVEADGVGYVTWPAKPAVPHGLRSTFRLWATEQGYDHRMAEIAPAHWQGDETERAISARYAGEAARHDGKLGGVSRRTGGASSTWWRLVHLAALSWPRAHRTPHRCRGVHVAARISDCNGVDQTSARRSGLLFKSDAVFSHSVEVTRHDCAGDVVDRADTRVQRAHDGSEPKALNAEVSANGRFWGRAMPLYSDCGLSD